jgi:hypothetical protein
MTEGSFPKSNGDILYASEINYLARPVKLVYTGTGFNANQTNGTTASAYELTAISSANLVGATYVKIRILCTHIATSTNSPYGGSASIKIEVKETGGSYGTILDNVLGIENNPYGISDSSVDTIEYYHTITAGQFTNGLQFKITGTAYANSGSDNKGNITNVQTILEVI